MARRLMIILLLLVAVIGITSPVAAQSELLTNGGFETDDFTGWTTAISTTNLWCVPGWFVVEANEADCAFEPVAPVSGTHMAVNSFDGGNAPKLFTLYQDVSIPANAVAKLNFSFRMQWYQYDDDWTVPRVMRVQIRATDNTLLETLYTFSTGLPSFGYHHFDTNWMPVNLDVSSYAGQTVRMYIEQTMPQNFTGGSLIFYDDFSLTAYTGSERPINVDHGLEGVVAKEGTFTDTLTFTLPQTPTSAVTVNLTTSNATCSVNPTSVVLDGSNWNTGVAVTVSADDDAVVDGTQNCTVQTAAATSSDAAYNGINTPDIVVNLLDNDGGLTVYSTCPPPIPRRNVPFSYTIAAAGAGTIIYDINNSALATGLTLNANTGLISGTPTTAQSDTTPNIIHARNNAVPWDQIVQPFLVVDDAVAAAPFFFDKAIPGYVGEFYCHRVFNRGSPIPTYTPSGTLPDGVTWDPVEMAYYGTPTTAQSTVFSLQATNASGTQNQNYSITIHPARFTGSITSPTPPDVLVNTVYTHTFTAAGSPPPAIGLQGRLPAGMTYNGSVLSGTPTVPGAYRLAAVPRTGVLEAAAQEFILDVNAAPDITSAAPPNTATVGTPYSHTFTATAHPAPTYTVTGGTLPNGLSLNAATGVLSGTPAEDSGGVYSNITVTASNGIGTNDTQTFNITVSESPDITSAAPPTTAAVGTAYSHTFTATGYPEPTFSLDIALPSGLSLNPTTGVLEGTPANNSGGVYGPYTLTATNGVGVDDTQVFSLTVSEAPEITSAAPPTATVGTAYSHTFTANGYPASTFSLTGTLPAGLTLNPTTGVLSGTPENNTGGVYNGFTVTATNGVAPNGIQMFSLTVNEAPSITSAAPPAATVGTAYSHTFTADGYPAATFSVTAGTLPSGLSLNPTTGLLSGTPADGTGGVYNGFTVTATNGTAPDGTQNFSLTINEAPSITSGLPPAATVGTAYSHTFTADGYPASTFSLTGTLPNGLSWNAGSATISGTPAEGTGGVYNGFTVTATNSIAPDGTQNFSLTVNEAPEITSAPPVEDVTPSTAYSHTFTASGYPAPTFSFSGTLPTGMTWDGVDTISGTPTVIGNFGPFTVTATNGIGTDDTQTFSLKIGAPPTITSASSSSGSVGTSYAFTVTATGNPAPTFSLTGALPTGLTWDAGTGLISGIPISGGSFPLTITASNGILPNATQNFTLTINSLANAVPRINVITTPLLTWGNVTWATGYQIEISASANMNPLLFPALTTNGNNATQITVAALTTDGIYYWRVRARTSTGSYGAWSAIQTFVLDVP